MSFIGETNERVVGAYAVLKLGANSFRLKQDFRLHIGRPRDRNASQAGPILSYGKGDSFLDATLLGSTPDITTFNALTQVDANGDLTYVESR